MKVERILKKGEKIEIFFSDKKKLTIAVDVFLDFPVSKKSELTEDEILEIKELQKKYEFKHKLIEFSKTKRRSSHEINLVLDKYGLSPEKKSEYRNLLKRYDLIDDRELAKIIVENQLKKKNGIKKIQQRLNSRHLNEFDCKNLIDFNIYKENLENLKRNLLEKHDQEPFSKKKVKIYTSLISKGYLHEESFVNENYYDEEKEIILAVKKASLFKKGDSYKNKKEKLIKDGFYLNVVDMVLKEE